MRLACAQLDLVGGDLDGNVDRAAAAVETAASEGADLVVLPELFTVGYFAFDAYARRAESLVGPTLTRLAGVAADRGVALLAGTVVEDLEATAAETDVPVPDGVGLANTAVVFDARGERRAVYRTHHLRGYDPGSPAGVGGDGPASALTLELGGESVTLGVTTTYDVGSPGIYRRLAERDCDLVCVPAAWAYPRLEHWNVLPRARAIENGYYVATVNGSGAFEDATLVGRSTVYDPMGIPLASSSEEPTLVYATVDPERVERVRGSFPVRGDRWVG
jgi:predicted amidohydrolase